MPIAYGLNSCARAGQGSCHVVRYLKYLGMTEKLSVAEVSWTRDRREVASEPTKVTQRETPEGSDRLSREPRTSNPAARILVADLDRLCD